MSHATGAIEVDIAGSPVFVEHFQFGVICFPVDDGPKCASLFGFAALCCDKASGVIPLGCRNCFGSCHCIVVVVVVVLPDLDLPPGRPAWSATFLLLLALSRGDQLGLLRSCYF